MTKLNLGCGNKRKNGYINIDIRKLPSVDRVMDISKLDYPNDSVDVIFSDQVLEHFPHGLKKENKNCVKNILKEWIRVLKSNGTITIGTIDIEYISRSIIEKKHKLEDCMRWIFGNQDYDHNYHKSTFTYEYLKRILNDLGIHKIEKIRSPTGGLTIKGVKK